MKLAFIASLLFVNFFTFTQESSFDKYVQSNVDQTTKLIDKVKNEYAFLKEEIQSDQIDEQAFSLFTGFIYKDRNVYNFLEKLNKKLINLYLIKKKLNKFNQIKKLDQEIKNQIIKQVNEINDILKRLESLKNCINSHIVYFNAANLVAQLKSLYNKELATSNPEELETFIKEKGKENKTIFSGETSYPFTYYAYDLENNMKNLKGYLKRLCDYPILLNELNTLVKKLNKIHQMVISNREYDMENMSK